MIVITSFNEDDKIGFCKLTEHFWIKGKDHMKKMERQKSLNFLEFGKIKFVFSHLV